MIKFEFNLWYEIRKWIANLARKLQIPNSTFTIINSPIKKEIFLKFNFKKQYKMEYKIRTAVKRYRTYIPNEESANEHTYIPL